MAKSPPRGTSRNQLAMHGLAAEAVQPPEWEAVESAIEVAHERDLASWAAFAGCTILEAFTDGSAPVRNPGGPAGCSAVILGYNEPVNPFATHNPEPHARLDLAAHIAARRSEPLTSNNRAEISGLVLAMKVLYRLGRMGCTPGQVTIWSDSTYAINCLNGTWKRKKNTDLWPLVDTLAEDVRQVIPCEVNVQWVRGHAGSKYNNAADELATHAAFNFDEDLYTRFRKAQTESGSEMPPPQAMVRQGLKYTKAPSEGS